MTGVGHIQSMSIQEVRDLKKATEDKISALIYAFQEQTGIRIYSVELTQIPPMTLQDAISDKNRFNTRIEISL